MQKLIQGLHRFQTDYFRPRREFFELLAQEQKPETLFVTCSDSRINPNLLTQTRPGELFILRNAGNIVPPGHGTGGGEEATIEYAVAALGVRDIIICGHSHCGAMKAILEPQSTDRLPAVRSWLRHAEATRRIVEENYAHLDPEARLTVAIEENVLVQLENLRTLPAVAVAIARGKVHLHGWVYKIETGEVFAYDPEQGQFLRLVDNDNAPLSLTTPPPNGLLRAILSMDVAVEVPGSSGAESPAAPSAPARSLPPPPGPVAPSFRHDAPAGLVVFLVALPLCLGIALASGAPLLSGLIAGVVAGLLISPLSGSPLSVSGPAAGLTVIVLQALTQLGSYRAFLSAVVLGGVFQLGLGALRAGVIVNFVPSSVIRGMLSAIGLVLIIKQLPHAVGYDSTPDADEGAVRGLVFEYNQALHEVGVGATLVALLSLGLLAFWPRLAQVTTERGVTVARGGLLGLLGRAPSALVVVLFGVAMNRLYMAFFPSIQIRSEHLVTLPVPRGVGDLAGYFTFPDLSRITDPKVIAVGLTLAIVASLETLLCVEAVDKLDPFQRRSSTTRELLAQGAGNIVSGLVGGLPITSVIVRSAANVNAGGRTWLSGFFHGLFLLLSALLLAPLLNLVPLSCLAAVLLFTGSRLASPSLFQKMARAGRGQLLPFLATIAVILATDLLKGIGAGLLLALLLSVGPVARSFRAGSALRPFRVEGKGSGQIRVALGHDVSFLAKSALMTEIDRAPDGAAIEIDGRDSRFVDPDVIEGLQAAASSAKTRGVQLSLLGLRPVEALGGH